jgi:serine-type D-Ala-D-Ala carboxypeptidase (penicillin-binding protein 5/6)
VPATRLARRGPIAILTLTVLVVGLPAAALAVTTLSTPPPTPVPVPGGGTSPSPFPTVLRTPTPGDRAPSVRAPSALLADLDSGQVLWDKDAEDRRPVASLTKIMTALLTLQRADPSDVVTVAPDATAPGATPGVSELGLLQGERISVRDLMYALLLQSANDAAVALADHVSGSVGAFVHDMNREARRMHLLRTRYASPSGLDDTGYSSARDLATMTRAAFERPLFAKIVSAKFHTIPAPSGPPRQIQNRDVLLWLYPGTLGGKTGYTSAAGFCVVAAAARDDVRLIAVVLGEPGEPFSDAASLLNYGFSAFERRDVVAGGQEFPSVDIEGHTVWVAAGRTLSRLVPVGGSVHRAVTVEPGTTFPPGVGEMVGFVTVSTPGLPLGRVPLVVASVSRPPPPQPGPWWRRAGSAVVHAVMDVLTASFG